LILIDSYGWIEYFTEGPLATAYAKYIEDANEENSITPTIVVYEVYKKLNKKGEQTALEAYAQITRTKIVDLTAKLSLEAAEISQSTSLGMADSIVLATARSCNAQIVTSDLHLKDMKETKFINK
jgi:predicted nucleic acid-binding protein